MKGLKVKCPNCTRICFETTDQFNPNVPPHGGMVKCLLQYHIDWLCVPTTKASEMCCPECLAPLVVGGVLNVIMPIREAGEAFQMEVPEGVTVIPEPDNPNMIPGGEPSDLTTPFTSDGNPTPATGEADLTKPSVPGFFCDVCGKECKSELGLNSHKKSHKPGGKK